MLVPHAELPAGISASWRSMRLADVIILLNDRQGWTRTRIAEWVEHFEERHASEIEPSDQPAQPVEPEAQDLDDLDEEGLVPALL
jgi:hypothetical protein